MPDLDESSALYRELTADRTTFILLIADRDLRIDVFAAIHSRTIHDHYARVCGSNVDADQADQAARALWSYIHHLWMWADTAQYVTP
jgi:hypothetical protein